MTSSLMNVRLIYKWPMRKLQKGKTKCTNKHKNSLFMLFSIEIDRVSGLRNQQPS